MKVKIAIQELNLLLKANSGHQEKIQPLIDAFKKLDEKKDADLNENDRKRYFELTHIFCSPQDKKLHEAIQTRHFPQAKELIKAGADITSRNEHGGTIFDSFVRAFDGQDPAADEIEFFRELHGSRPKLLNSTNIAGLTPLAQASEAKAPSLTLVRALLSQGAVCFAEEKENDPLVKWLGSRLDPTKADFLGAILLDSRSRSRGQLSQEQMNRVQSYLLVYAAQAPESELSQLNSGLVWFLANHPSIPLESRLKRFAQTSFSEKQKKLDQRARSIAHLLGEDAHLQAKYREYRSGGSIKFFLELIEEIKYAIEKIRNIKLAISYSRGKDTKSTEELLQAHQTALRESFMSLLNLTFGDVARLELLCKQLRFPDELINILSLADINTETISQLITVFKQYPAFDIYQILGVAMKKLYENNNPLPDNVAKLIKVMAEHVTFTNVSGQIHIDLAFDALLKKYESMKNEDTHVQDKKEDWFEAVRVNALIDRKKSLSLDTFPSLTSAIENDAASCVRIINQHFASSTRTEDKSSNPNPLMNLWQQCLQHKDPKTVAKVIICMLEISQHHTARAEALAELQLAEKEKRQPDNKTHNVLKQADRNIILTVLAGYAAVISAGHKKSHEVADFSLLFGDLLGFDDNTAGWVAKTDKKDRFRRLELAAYMSLPAITTKTLGFVEDFMTKMASQMKALADVCSTARKPKLPSSSVFSNALPPSALSAASRPAAKTN